MRQEGFKFIEDLSIPCYQTNGQGMLRPAAFMDQAQELAFWAAAKLGFGYDNLHEHHVAWVLCRMHFRFLKELRWRDRLSLATWHKGSTGLFYLRDFDGRNEAGEQAVVCTSSWVVIDERTRRFVRPEDMAQKMSWGIVNESAIEEQAPKIQLPENGQPELAGEHTVSYSDIDLIGHTNNARYVVWAMDVLPLEDALRPVKDLYINFNKETTRGETVQLYRLFAEDAWYVEGRVAGKPCFVVKMVF